MDNENNTPDENNERSKIYYEENKDQVNQSRREKTKRINELIKFCDKNGITNKADLEKRFNDNSSMQTTTTTTPQQDLTKVFDQKGLNNSNIMIVPTSINGHNVTLNETYLERQNEFRDLEIQAKNEKSKCLCFLGRSGTGKTMIGKAFAEKNNLPCLVFSCSEDIRRHDLLGSPMMLNGSSVFQPSVFLQAVDIANNHSSKTCVVIIDEVNTLDPAVMKNLNENMNWYEGIYIAQVAHKWKLNSDSKIIIVGTMNPNYTATNDLTRELISRFSFRVWNDWTDRELKRMFKKWKLDEVYADCIIQLNSQINTAYKNDELSIDQDSREMIKIVESYQNHLAHGLTKVESMTEALDLNVISKYELIDDKAEIKTVMSFVDSIFPKVLEEDQTQADQHIKDHKTVSSKTKTKAKPKKRTR